jgi:DNA adenine methylase
VQVNEIPNKFKKAPFPYFGGKSKIAGEVWTRLGNPAHYVEPFCGSAAMLLANPAPCSLEVINDMNFYIANFWRCIKYQPDAVYVEQDYPVSHVDLDARHVWLTNPARVAELRAKLADPEWCGDARIAGWWVWGQCCWIASGWCEKEVISDAGMGVQSRIPHISNAGMGVQSKVPHIGNAGRGVQSKVPPIGDAGRGVHDWFQYLSWRLERVRVLHGDWTRCLNSHYGDQNGGTAYFFDPPYLKFEGLYQAGADVPVARAVEVWCRENAAGHKIALCGLIGDYDLPGWSTLVWDRGRLTYGGSNNGDKECIWFSPDCINPDAEVQGDIFEEAHHD